MILLCMYYVWCKKRNNDVILSFNPPILSPKNHTHPLCAFNFQLFWITFKSTNQPCKIQHKWEKIKRCQKRAPHPRRTHTLSKNSRTNKKQVCNKENICTNLHDEKKKEVTNASQKGRHVVRFAYFIFCTGLILSIIAESHKL